MPNEFKVKNGLLVSGSANITASGSAVFTIDGTAGRLFTVDDTTSGSLFSVNTSAGLPIIEAFSDNTVRIGQSGQRALFVSQSKVGINKESALNGLLDVSGSLTVTGSIGILGTVSASSYTGSLLGTASFATSASSAISSSFAVNSAWLDGLDSSVFATTGSNTFIGTQTVSGSVRTTGSMVLTGSLGILGTVSASSYTGSLLGTASFATSASWAPGGSGASFPYTGSAVITGSLIVTGSTTSTLGFTGSLFGTASWATNALTASFFGGNSNLPSLQARRTGSYTLTGTFADLTFDQNEYVGDANVISHSLGVNTERFFTKQAGPYLITYTFQFAGSANTDVEARLLVNGNTFISSSFVGGQVSSTDDIVITKTVIANLTATDYFTLQTRFPGTTGGSIVANTATVGIARLAAVGSGTGGGGGGTPEGADTTIQFNDAGAFSGSGNFTFTKATNTVRIQASGSTLLVISGSQGELLRVQDSGSSPGTLAVISSGSLNVATFTTSSVIITGSLQVSGSLTASLQRGYAWVGDSNGIATPTPRVNTATSLFLFFNY